MCHVANDKLCATLPEAVYKDTQLMNAHTNNNVIMSPLHLWCYLSIYGAIYPSVCLSQHLVHAQSSTTVDPLLIH